METAEQLYKEYQCECRILAGMGRNQSGRQYQTDCVKDMLNTVRIAAEHEQNADIMAKVAAILEQQRQEARWARVAVSIDNAAGRAGFPYFIAKIADNKVTAKVPGNTWERMAKEIFKLETAQVKVTVEMPSDIWREPVTLTVSEREYKCRECGETMQDETTLPNWTPGELKTCPRCHWTAQTQTMEAE
jgi:hypothetical protein